MEQLLTREALNHKQANRPQVIFGNWYAGADKSRVSDRYLTRTLDHNGEGLGFRILRRP
jgi:hypothetical protein